MSGYIFMSIKSAEGRRAPGNISITQSEYDESCKRILEAIDARMKS